MLQSTSLELQDLGPAFPKHKREEGGGGIISEVMNIVLYDCYYSTLSGDDMYLRMFVW